MFKEWYFYKFNAEFDYELNMEKAYKAGYNQARKDLQKC